jgi:hypothetical protein
LTSDLPKTQTIPATDLDQSDVSSEIASVQSGSLVRDTSGKFVAGASGNPKGRAKGSRNAITIRRLETEQALRNFLAPKAKDILAKAVEMALAGNEKMLTVLLDKTLSSLRTEDVGETKDTEIKVQINNLTAINRDRVKPVVSTVRISPVPQTPGNSHDG